MEDPILENSTPQTENLENTTPNPQSEPLAPSAADAQAQPEVAPCPEAPVSDAAPAASPVAPESPASEPICEDAPAAEPAPAVEIAPAPEPENAQPDAVCSDALVPEENPQPVDNEPAISQEFENQVCADIEAQAQAHQASADNEPEKEAAEPETDYSKTSREDLMVALQALLNNEEILNIRHRVTNIKQRFIALSSEEHKKQFEAFIAAGGEKDKYQSPEDPLADAFHKLYDSYREKRQQALDAIEKIKQENLAKKEEVLDSLRKLVIEKAPTTKEAYDRFNAIQTQWKAIGDVPREKVNDLWANYHHLVQSFFDEMHKERELRDLGLRKNLEQKVQLCEKAEELIVETSINKAIKALQGLRSQWREIGPVPNEQNEEIWNRFRNAISQIEERRNTYFEQRRKEMADNLLAKRALIERVNEVTATLPDSTKAWTDTSALLDSLMDMWKAIGPVDQEHNEETWKLFKSPIDNFYAAKKEFFAQQRDQQTENYNRKIDLCLKAEALAQREDWNRATDEIKQLQAEWKEIGPIEHRQSERLWKRFRGACDSFFTRKSEYFKNQRGSEQDNLAKKEALIQELCNHQFGDDKEENLAVIKDFQRRWMEIGHVPIAEKERLYNQFRSLIDDYFNKLKSRAQDDEERAYRVRVKNLTSGGRRIVSDEKQALLNAIDEIKGNLSLWENNLGFLSNSRSAEVLKQEFEKKMQHSREQLALLEQKLRILNQSEDNEKNDKKDSDNK